MATSSQTYKNVFKQIFADGWDDFKRTHPRYESGDEVVQKMLGCGDPALGHAVYLCPDCQQRRVVAFSCKSQFCLSCAKLYGQDWVAYVVSPPMALSRIIAYDRERGSVTYWYRDHLKQWYRRPTML